MTIIRFKDLSFSYDPDMPILSALTLEINRGDTWAVIGPNGCGKSTLLKLIVGALTPTRGHISVAATPQSKNAIAYVGTEIDPHLPFSVKDVLLMGRFPFQSIWDDKQAATEDKCQAVARLFELDDSLDTPMTALSAGQQQRVHLARAWMQDPAILLLDEPFTHLDLGHQVALAEQLQKIQNDTTVVMVSHHVDTALALATHVLWLSREGVHACGRRDDINNKEALEKSFGLTWSRYSQIRHAGLGGHNR